jgi:hypothetical protein
MHIIHCVESELFTKTFGAQSYREVMSGGTRPKYVELRYDRKWTIINYQVKFRSKYIIYKSSVFWDITPRSSLKCNRCFGGKCHIHLHGRKIKYTRNQFWKSKQAEQRPSMATRRHIPEDGTVHYHCCDNREFYKRCVHCSLRVCKRHTAEIVSSRKCHFCIQAFSGGLHSDFVTYCQTRRTCLPIPLARTG